MTENKKTNKWKVVAIIFIILLALETLFVVWGVALVNEEERKTNECFYNICGDYEDAFFYEDVCSCYDYDNHHELVIVKSEYMK